MMHFCHCVMLYSKHVLLRAYVVSSAWPSEHWRKLTNELLMLVAGNIAYTSTAMMTYQLPVISVTLIHFIWHVPLFCPQT